jgi:hypothetical protein
MKYVLSVDSVFYECPVERSEEEYLQAAYSHLVDLSDDDYMSGLAAVLHTGAHYSYVLDSEDVLWLIEWEPGLIVVKLSPNGQMRWTALRSPVPDFGGRVPLPEDGSPDDYDGVNPQYKLIFTSIDAAEDPEFLEDFSVADEETVTAFQTALAHVNTLEAKVEKFAPDEVTAWLRTCKDNLAQRCGEGIRLRT